MPENDSKIQLPKHRDILVSLGLVVFSLILYFCSYSHDFTFDDYNHVQTNKLITEFSPLKIFSSPTWPGNLYRPAFISSLALTYQFSELDPKLYHLGNIAQNAFMVGALFYMLNLLFGFRLAILASFLFACHPIHVETVANVSHRSEIMAALFGVLAIIFSLKRHYLFAGLFLFVSFCSKESALTFALLLPLAVIFQETEFKHWKFKFEFKQFLLLALPAIAYLGLRVNALGQLFPSKEAPFYVVNPLAHMSFFERLPHAILNFGHYLANLLFPFRLSPDYSYSHLGVLNWGSLGLILQLALLIGFLFLLFRGGKRATFFCLWFFVSLLITANLLLPIGTIFADRLAYLPSVSLCGLTALFILKINKDFVRVSVFGLIIVLFSLQTLSLQKIWQSNETLHSYAIKVVPNSAKTQQNYAIVCLNQGRLDDAALHFRMALEIYPQYADAAYRMSFVYKEKGIPKGVEHWLKKALEINPKHGPALRDLGEMVGGKDL